jgi:transcriptional regulator with XRE-family HTH domain
MTPFGQRVRQLRAERKVSLKAMAEALEVSSAYLSALEHGRRGAPTWIMVQRIITYFNVIWDEAEELQRLAERSHPRVTIDTAGLDPQATELAHLLANSIAGLGPKSLRDLKKAVTEALKRDRPA